MNDKKHTFMYLDRLQWNIIQIVRTLKFKNGCCLKFSNFVDLASNNRKTTVLLNCALSEWKGKKAAPCEVCPEGARDKHQLIYDGAARQGRINDRPGRAKINSTKLYPGRQRSCRTNPTQTTYVRGLGERTYALPESNPRISLYLMSSLVFVFFHMRMGPTV